ncbi:hypothetical protein D3C77_535540 [compost metagenome]
MSQSGRLYRSHIPYEPVDRRELAASDSLDQETADKGMANRGLGNCRGCLCRHDVPPRAILPIYVPCKICILCRHAMYRIWLC